MIRLKDIAEKAGVSIMTVSKVLRDAPDVAAATKARVRQLAEQMGYMPDTTAQGLRTRTTRLFGLLVPATNAKLVVLGPTGMPRTVPTTLHGDRAEATFALDQAGSFTVQLSVTLLMYQPLLPGVPATNGTMIGAVESSGTPSPSASSRGKWGMRLVRNAATTP